MSKINFTYEDQQFTLEFSRRTVQQMEKAGFSLDGVANQPATYIPMLFQGAFLMHHQRTKEATINAIFNCIEEKDELMSALIDMYREPLETMFDDPEDEGKKVSWKKE